MRIIIQSTAHNSIDSLFDYLSNYSIKNAIDTIEEIYSRIYNLEFFPYIGREIPEIADGRFVNWYIVRPGNLLIELCIIYLKRQTFFMFSKLLIVNKIFIGF